MRKLWIPASQERKKVILSKTKCLLLSAGFKNSSHKIFVGRRKLYISALHHFFHRFNSLFKMVRHYIILADPAERRNMFWLISCRKQVTANAANSAGV